MRGFRKTAWLIGLLFTAVWAQQQTQLMGWKMQDSATVGPTAGTAIAASTFDASSWYTATVPGTVLNTLADQGIYPNPVYGENMLTPANGGQIPDIASAQKRYWFYDTFSVTAAAGQRVWLEFGGINYKAYIYLNGQYLDSMYGAFREKKIDITTLINGSAKNYLAVKIRGNLNPGTEHTKQSGNCGSNGGVMSQDGPTFIASQGWDWIPTVADRDMGIWKPVYVRVTGPVELRHPWVRTLNVSTASATIPVWVTLMNTSGASVTGTLSGVIDSATQLTSQTVTVPGTAPGDSVIDSFPSYTMTNPTLWWPNGYGSPILHTLKISFTPNGASTPSDTILLKFGVRQFSYTTTPSLTITCNGQRILCRGGNWGMDDAQKRWDLHKLTNKVRYHKEMNFNVVRDWIGMTDCEPFYALCDSFGIMIWSDFWEPHSADQPVPVGDQANYIANMGDKILRARNHASVAIWCERNETTPTAAFLTALTNYHATLDGTRYVQPSSGSNGAHSGGPYTWTAIQSVYGAISGFHTEFGGPHVMSYESMQATFPTADQMPMGNTWWSFHDYCSGNGTPANYTNAMTATWTAPAGSNLLYDCTKKAQLMNYDEARASEETISAKAFNGVTGLLLWMSNCVWPSLMWQSYDYYMEGTGGFFGFMKGSEPVHAQYYAAASSQIVVINNTMSAISNYSLKASTYNINGTQAWTNTNTAVNVAAGANAAIFTPTAGTSTPYFLDIKLRNASGNLVSHNFYWEPSNGSNISGMLDSTKLANVSVVQTAGATWTRAGVENTIALNIVNPSTNAVPAVFCRIKLTQDSVMGTRILPVHFNENYFSLLPGDTQVVTMKFDEVDRAGHQPVVSLTGINVRPMTFTIGVVPVRRSIADNTGKTGFSSSFVGNKLRLNNVAPGSGWEVRLFDMQGRLLMSVQGAKGQAAVVSLDRMHPGAYVAVAKSAGETISTMLTITR